MERGRRLRKMKGWEEAKCVEFLKDMDNAKLV